MTLPLLERALGQTESVIAAIGPSQAARPTPCPQWTVRDLVEHLTGRGLRNFQIAELAVHGWDLVIATGVDVPLDDELAEHALAWSRGMLRPEHRGEGKAFAAEVPVPADAPAYARLAGWFGRDPAWRSPA